MSNDLTNEDAKILEAKTKNLLIALKKKGFEDLKCAFCGNTDIFNMLGKGDILPVVPLSRNSVFYRAYALSCDNCGFVHTFHADVIDRIAK